MQLTQEEIYRVWLYDALGANGGRMGALLASYGDAEQVFAAARTGELTFAGKRAESIEARLIAAAKTADLDALPERYEKLGVTPVCRISENYPVLLREIYDPPEMLFVKGRLPAQIELPLAVIGSRKCTEYGKETAHKLARALADAGACIISGLAYGLDVVAARGAMESKNPHPTVAVLGCGVDIPYPVANRRDYARIVECGAVVSEFLPGTAPLPAFFPQRNRIISGLAKGTVVVEAAEQSGTSITVRFALEQGRDVFAVPGRITDPQSRGTNRYIRDGYAKAVLDAADILCEYGIEVAPAPERKLDLSALSVEQAVVCRLLQASDRSFDELCEMTALPPARLNSILTVLEFSGIIRQMSGRMYKL